MGQVAAMVMIGNLLYAWTMCVQPMMAGTGWELSQCSRASKSLSQ